MTPPRDVRTRQQLSEFLKTRRARLSPADVGLPSGRNRRIGGLRREEVAALSGVGLTWYTWLEQGRDIRVSSAFLEQLARALQLSQAERGHLFVLARHQTPPLDARDAPASDPERLHIMLESIVCPAYARNARFDVLAWNGANTRMFGDFAAVAPARRNVLRLMFTQPSYRRTMVNWVADARSLVAKFRLNFGRAAGAEDFAGLVDELSIASADFRRLWAEHDVSDLGEGVTTFSSARHGVEVFRHHTMMPEALPHLRIVMLIPERGPEERGDHSPALEKGDDHGHHIVRDLDGWPDLPAYVQPTPCRSRVMTAPGARVRVTAVPARKLGLDNFTLSHAQPSDIDSTLDERDDSPCGSNNVPRPFMGARSGCVGVMCRTKAILQGTLD